MFADSSATFNVLVKLTYATGEYTHIIVRGDGTNIAYVGVDIDVFILPENNVQFDVQEYTASIVGTYPGISYTTYNFDATNDTVIDSTASAEVVFSHTYNADSTAKINVVTSVGNIDTTIGVQTLTISSLSELIVNSESECTELEIWSQTANYVEKLVARGDVDNSEMEYLGVTITMNCCESEAKEFKLAPLYQFSLNNTTCEEDELSPVTVNGYSYLLYNTNMVLSGIDPSVIAELRFDGGNRNTPGTLVVNTNSPVTEFTVQYLMPNEIPVPPVVTEDYTIVITTTAGFEYTINYRITPNFLSAPGSCAIGIEINNVTYPENPCYVTVVEDLDRTYLNIDSQLYYGCLENDEELEAMSDGIYTVEVNDSGISNEFVTGCEFVNCDTYCLVLKALANECDPVIQIIYDALVGAKDCDVISCQNYCDLYEMLLALLEECDCVSYTNNKVSKQPCGCNK